MRIQRWGAAVMTAGALVLASCGAGVESSPTTTTVTVTETETPMATASETSAEARSEVSGAVEVKLGEPIAADVVEFTVSDVRDVTNPADTNDNGTWAAMIEICATGDLGGPIAPMNLFTLLSEDHGTYQPNGSTGGTMPTPQLDPGMLSVPQGECRKGNLFFSAPPDATITGAEAVDSFGDSMGTWTK